MLILVYYSNDLISYYDYLVLQIFNTKKLPFPLLFFYLCVCVCLCVPVLVWNSCYYCPMPTFRFSKMFGKKLKTKCFDFSVFGRQLVLFFASKMLFFEKKEMFSKYSWTSLEQGFLAEEVFCFFTHLSVNFLLYYTISCCFHLWRHFKILFGCLISAGNPEL